MSSDDRMAVVHTTNLYATAVDTLQWALLDRVFTADIRIDFGGGALWSGLEPLREAFAAIHAPFKATQHITTNHTVSVDGDRAWCFSYVHGRFIRDLGAGDEMFESGGWYDDTLVRAGADWLICKRVCRSIWVNGNPEVLATGPETGIPELFSPAAEAAAGRLDTLASLLS